MNNAFFGAARGLSFLPLTACRSPTDITLCRTAAATHALRRFFSIAKNAWQFAPARTSVRKEAENGLLVKSVVWAHFRSRRNFHAGPQCLIRTHGGSPSSQKTQKGSRVRSKDGHGFRFPFKNFSEADLLGIFKHDVSQADGNKVLRTLHERRVTGALIDFGVKIEDVPGVPYDALTSALTWLREKYPVDEEAAAQQWANAEAKRLENTYIARAVKLGIYAEEPSSRVGKRNSSARVEQSKGYTTSNTGISVLEMNKQYHAERRRKEAEAAKESGEEEERAKNRELAIVAEKEKAELRAKRKSDYVAYYREKATIIKDDKFPEMPLWKRLGPSTLFAAVLLTSFYYFAQLYTPPAQSQRLFPNLPTAVATVTALIGINCLLFCVWQLGPAWRFMNMYFLQIPGYPYAFGILGNVFSHQKFWHLAGNMAGVALYGISVHEDIGRGNFLALYLSSGVIGSISSLWFHVLKQRFTSYHFGASGAVWGIMMAWAVLTATKSARPSESWGFISDVGLYAALVMQLILHFTPGVLTQVDVVSHAGGGVTGFFAAWFLTKQAKAKRKRDGMSVEERETADRERGATKVAKRKQEVESEERRKWEEEREKERKKNQKVSFVRR